MIGPPLGVSTHKVPPVASSGVEGGTGGWGHSYSMDRSATLCVKCGRIHSGECRLGERGCYHYGQIGHLQINYPRRGQSQWSRMPREP